MDKEKENYLTWNLLMNDKSNFLEFMAVVFPFISIFYGLIILIYLNK